VSQFDVAAAMMRIAAIWLRPHWSGHAIAATYLRVLLLLGLLVVVAFVVVLAIMPVVEMVLLSWVRVIYSAILLQVSAVLAESTFHSLRTRPSLNPVRHLMPCHCTGNHDGAVRGVSHVPRNAWYEATMRGLVQQRGSYSGVAVCCPTLREHHATCNGEKTGANRDDESRESWMMHRKRERKSEREKKILRHVEEYVPSVSTTGPVKAYAAPKS
jgi:hypothetical protein